MSTLIKNLHIKNFKSVRDLKLDCDRINIFIGKPNAGKSNILEAISLLGAEYSESNKFMSDFIRYGKISQLFSNNNFRSPINVKADDITASLEFQNENNDFLFKINIEDTSQKKNNGERGAKLINLNAAVLSTQPVFQIDHISHEGSCSGARWNKMLQKVKKYVFRLIDSYKDKGFYLQPPYGENFYFIAQSHPELLEEIAQFLRPNGLELLFDEETRRLSVLQRGEKSSISIPMGSVPDTFQRYIFHLAAIMSNRDSVLLFEEPEAHSYAPYVYQLAQHILDDKGGNQYFITTHNPYLLTPILQDKKDVALFITWFKDYQTHARRLSEEEVSDILNYGMDVFLNLKHFIPA